MASEDPEGPVTRRRGSPVTRARSCHPVRPPGLLAGAPGPKHCKLGVCRSRRSLSRHSGSWKSETKVSTGSVPSEGRKGDSVRLLSPCCCCWFAWHPLSFSGSYVRHLALGLHLYVGLSPRACLCPSCPLMEGCQSHWSRGPFYP